AFRVAAKFSDQIGKKLGCFFHRNVAAIAYNDHLRVKYLIAKFVSVMDRYDLILVAPNDERWLVDQMRVGFYAFGVPMSRRRKNRMMRIRSVQRTSNVFDTPCCYEIKIFRSERRPHSVSDERGRIDKER